MGLTRTRFDELARKYGRHASWAIWNHENAADTRVIAEQLSCLKSSVVLVGLNVSTHQPPTWENFHGNDHARKLMFAFNESPYRGAYMTDLIKGEVEPNAARLLARIKSGSIDIQKHLDSFRTEMLEVGVQKHSLFILFGEKVFKLFKSHLASIYPNFVRCVHYSMYGKGYSDAEWIERTWKTLEEHCGGTMPDYKTLEFVRNDPMIAQLQKLKDNQNRRNKITTPALAALQ